MESSGSKFISGDGNIIGDGSQSQVQKVEALGPTYVITSLSNRLSASDEAELHRDWVTYALSGVFVILCLAAVFAPLILYEYSARTPAMQDIRDLVLTLSSAMSGVTGLIGVLVGYRIRDRKPFR